MRVRFTAEVRAELRAIALYIARDNKMRAKSFAHELEEKSYEIADMPRAFPLVPDYERHGIRRRPYGNYLIFYRIDGEQISILHILHGARDYEPLLFPE